MSPDQDADRRPRIVITVAVAERSNDPDRARRKNELYAEAIERHGAEAIPLDVRASSDERLEALAAMDGLLLSGGVDIHPARYGAASAGAKEISRERDALEAEAWDAALARSLPILGLCRGLQAINVFSGGSLLQHVDGHAGPGWGEGPTRLHDIRLDADTRLATILAPLTRVTVNSFHHQAVRASDLAAGLRPSAWADSVAGPIIEGIESADDRFIVGVQCHPERTDSTPAVFEGLFAAFVAAASPGGAEDGGSNPAVVASSI
jgi:putative glutamine amidotransferase